MLHIKAKSPIMLGESVNLIPGKLYDKEYILEKAQVDEEEYKKLIEIGAIEEVDL